MSERGLGIMRVVVLREPHGMLRYAEGDVIAHQQAGHHVGRLIRMSAEFAAKGASKVLQQHSSREERGQRRTRSQDRLSRVNQ